MASQSCHQTLLDMTPRQSLSMAAQSQAQEMYVTFLAASHQQACMVHQVRRGCHGRIPLIQVHRLGAWILQSLCRPCLTIT